MSKDAPAPYAIAGKETILATAEAKVTLMTLDPGQGIPPHRHGAVTDHTFCLSGTAAVVLSDPEETLLLSPGDRATVPPGRVHEVANRGDAPAQLLLVQGPGAYDFQPA
ncbi:cupin domain-containing protein [Solidesulfovibrio sp.]|uniref:cupin domain-containing protein n=1 Tax=Solidesulfovibrio sp. TaxID=2910990 RepID=UPI00262627CC|nr:cupin domain-containing protein [Solidesulfovibrio sp.]